MSILLDYSVLVRLVCGRNSSDSISTEFYHPILVIQADSQVISFALTIDLTLYIS